MVQIIPYYNANKAHGEQIGAQLATLAPLVSQLQAAQNQQVQKTRVDELQRLVQENPNVSANELAAGLAGLPKEYQAPYLPLIKQKLEMQGLAGLDIPGLETQTPTMGLPTEGIAPPQDGQADMGSMSAIQSLAQQKPQIGVNAPYPQDIINKATKAGSTGKALSDRMVRFNDQLVKKEIGQQKLNFQRDKEFTKQIADSYERQKPYLQSQTEQYKSYQTIKPDMQKIKVLGAQKDVQGKFVRKALDHFGIDPDILTSGTAEQIEKINQNQVRQVSRIFRGKILDREVESFMKSIPGLMQSQEGREKIANSLLTLGQAVTDEYQARRELEKEFEGRPLPYDFEERVIEKIQPKLDMYAKAYREGVPIGDAVVPLNRSIEEDNKILNDIYIASKGNKDTFKEIMRKRGYKIG